MNTDTTRTQHGFLHEVGVKLILWAAFQFSTGEVCPKEAVFQPLQAVVRFS